MRRIALALFGSFALLLSLSVSVGAQDVLNCGSFVSQAAAQSVYDADPSDPNQLDGSPENGQACDSHDYGSNAGTNPGLLGGDDGASTGDTSTGDTGTDVTGPADTDDSAAGGGTETLPATGSGPMTGTSGSAAPFVGASALLVAGAAMFIRRTAIGRS